MYNREIKERFLAEYEGNRKVSSRPVLDAIGIHEEACDKDFAEMQKQEAIEAIKYVHVGTYGTAFGVLSFIRSYIKWCSKNSVFCNLNTELSSLTVDDIDISDDLRAMLFKSEDELIAALRSVRPFDDGYHDVIVIVLAWLGLSQDQALSLGVDDVDFESHTIKLEDKVVKISDNIGEILRVYSRTKTGTRMNKNGPRIVYRDDSYNKFVRKFSSPAQLGKELTKKQLQSTLYILNESYVEAGNKPRFTSSNVMASGALYRVSELEHSGVDVFSIKYKKLVTDVYRVDAKLHEILWLYNNYKRAFNL